MNEFIFENAVSLKIRSVFVGFLTLSKKMSAISNDSSEVRAILYGFPGKLNKLFENPMNEAAASAAARRLRLPKRTALFGGPHSLINSDSNAASSYSDVKYLYLQALSIKNILNSSCFCANSFEFA